MGLTPFEGRDVIQSTIRVTRAGDGLSTALNVEPAEYHVDDTLYVLLECTVSDVGFPAIKNVPDVRQRRHTLIAGVGTIVDADWARSAIAEQRRRNLAAAGVTELPLDDDDQ